VVRTTIKVSNRGNFELVMVGRSSNRLALPEVRIGPVLQPVDLHCPQYRDYMGESVPYQARVGHLPGAVDRVMTVTSGGLPVGAEPQISEDLRQRGIVVVQGLFADGKVDQNAFQRAVDGLLAVQSEAEFASLMRSLPPPVAVTPPALLRQEPLEIATSMGEVRLDGRWQVGRLTKIDTGMGAVIVDLTEAEFDDWDVEIVVRTRMGAITTSLHLASTSDLWAGTARSPPPLSRRFRASLWCGSAQLPTWALSAW